MCMHTFTKLKLTALIIMCKGLHMWCIYHPLEQEFVHRAKLISVPDGQYCMMMLDRCPACMNTDVSV